MTQLARTSSPGIYRAHGAKCNGTGRCDCPYVIMWRHRGRQHKETCLTFNEAREKKSLRDSVDSKPIERTRFGDYFPEWIETYAGRTQRGFSETTAIPEDWHLFFEFLVHTGLRISEMIGLTWEHMELENNPHVKVREQFYRCQRQRLKSGSGRRDIPLAPRMTARLIEQREANYSGPTEPVFTSDVGTELIRSKVADRVLNPARALVGMPWVEEGVGSADFLDDAIEVGRGPWLEDPEGS